MYGITLKIFPQTSPYTDKARGHVTSVYFLYLVHVYAAPRDFVRVTHLRFANVMRIVSCCAVDAAAYDM